MLEIAFSESAGGGLKLAQHYGVGEYFDCSAAIGIIGGADGGEADITDIAAEIQTMREAQRRKWGSAEPLGGSADDVCVFNLNLSVGDIGGDVPGEGRRHELSRIYSSVYPQTGDSDIANELLQSAQSGMKKLSSRLPNGEGVRVWYSSEPDELCGMYWFMSVLHELHFDGEAILVKLPELCGDGDGTVLEYSSWGEVDAPDFKKLSVLSRTVNKAEIAVLAQKWFALRRDNSPLRAAVNGQLTGVGEDFYDRFILGEAVGAPNEFNEASLIGRIIGMLRLGLSDAWLALRFEHFIDLGLFEPVTLPGEDDPIYHKVLRKTDSFFELTEPQG